MNKGVVLSVFSFFLFSSVASAFLPLSDGRDKIRILPEVQTVTPLHEATALADGVAETFGPQARLRIDPFTGGIAELTGPLTEPSAGRPEDLARSFVDRLQGLALAGRADSPAELVQERATVLNGSAHVRFRQTYDGTPVVGRGATVHLDGRGAVNAFQSSYDPDLRITNERAFDRDEAMRKALAYLEAEAADRAPARVEAVLLPVGGHAAIEAYQVFVSTNQPLGDWVVTLDAGDGSVLGCENHLQAARGSVYASHPLAGGPVAKTLKNIDGSGNLKGAYAKVINEDTDDAQSAEGKFLYDPEDTHFDEVMVFYHMNVIHDFFKSLGFNDLDETLSATVHYRTGYDNAFFSPWGKNFSFGDGNRLNDLATEAGVIYHEYTHAVTNEIQSMAYSGEAGAMNEAFSDYFACSQDGDAKIGEWIMKKLNKPYMRSLNNTKHYPEDIVGEVHADGEIWGASMWAIYKRLGKSVADKVIHHCRYYLGSSRPSFKDGLKALIKADETLYGGSHVSAIKEVLGKKGITLDTGDEPSARQGQFLSLYGPRS